MRASRIAVYSHGESDAPFADGNLAGVTLIELPVVLAIIALLASLLLRALVWGEHRQPTLIVGAAALLQDVTMDRQTQFINFPAMLVVMALLLGMLLTDRRVTRREGEVLLRTYGVYLAVLTVMTMIAKR